MDLEAVGKSVRRVIMAKQPVEKQVPRFGTGCDVLDLVVGGGQGMGYPAGKIINIVGDKSSGKTFLACEIIANAFHRYGTKLKWVYDDAESGFTFNTKELYGVEIMPQNPKERVKSRTVEDMFCNYKLFLRNLKEDELGIYVVDSLDGLTSDENEKRGAERLKAFEEDKEFKQGSYQMGAAKFLSQEFFKGITEETEEKNCLLIIISQVRANIDPMSFDKYTRAGGKALDFYAHTVLWLAYLTKIVRKERSVGVVVKAKTTKSKTPRPYRECIFTLLFDYGLDNIGTNIDFLFDLRTDAGRMNKEGNAIIWDGKDQTVANLQAFLEQESHLEKYKKEYKNIKKSDMLQYIKETPELEANFAKFFGSPMSRDELISYIEQKKLSKELTRRVIEQWEAIEESIRSNRPPKYLD
jgi:recombination protein RecA